MIDWHLFILHSSRKRAARLRSTRFCSFRPEVHLGLRHRLCSYVTHSQPTKTFSGQFQMYLRWGSVWREVSYWLVFSFIGRLNRKNGPVLINCWIDQFNDTKFLTQLHTWELSPNLMKRCLGNSTFSFIIIIIPLKKNRNSISTSLQCIIPCAMNRPPGIHRYKWYMTAGALGITRYKSSPFRKCFSLHAVTAFVARRWCALTNVPFQRFNPNNCSFPRLPPSIINHLNGQCDHG